MLGAIAGNIIDSRFEGHPRPPAGFELFHPHCRFTDGAPIRVATVGWLAATEAEALELAAAQAAVSHKSSACNSGCPGGCLGLTSCSGGAFHPRRSASG